MHFIRLGSNTELLHKYFHRILQEHLEHFACNCQGVVPKNIKDKANK